MFCNGLKDRFMANFLYSFSYSFHSFTIEGNRNMFAIASNIEKEQQTIAIAQLCGLTEILLKFGNCFLTFQG